jgi:O-antigen/teichoic acid export membrane protein
MTGRQDIYLQERPRRQPRVSSLPPLLSRLGSLPGALRHNQDILRNASSLAITAGLTSLIGFAYWIYAARVFSIEAVGYGSAAISTMMLIGTLGMFGLDTMLIGELPRRSDRGSLTMAACIAAFVISLVLGLGFALLSLAFGTHFVEINGTVWRMALFSFGVGITGALLVFDAATIGIMRGGLQLSRNVGLAVAKMIALPVAALILHDAFGVGLLLAWVLGTVLSVLPVAIIIRRGGGSIMQRPDWASLRQLRKLAIAHNWLNLAINIPPKIIVVLVAIVVSPSENGAYYVAGMLYAFLYMIVGSLSTMLFATASADPGKIGAKLRFVLSLSLILGIPLGLALGVSSPFILSAFGSGYAALAVGPLWLQIAGYIPGIPNAVYISVARAQGRFNQAAVFQTIWATIRMVAVVVGGKADGLWGLSFALLAVSIAQALFTTPTVLRTAFGSLRVGTAGKSVAADEAEQSSWARVEEERLRQEAGLAALIALADKVSSSSARSNRHRAHSSETGWAARLRMSMPQQALPGKDLRRDLSILAATRSNSLLTDTGGIPLLTDTRWWPGFDEANFRLQQESGVAALIAIAEHAAGPGSQTQAANGHHVAEEERGLRRPRFTPHRHNGRHSR